MNELVRCVSVFIRDAESQQHGIEAQELLELNHDGYGSALSLKERFFAKPFMKGRGSCLHTRTVDRCDRRLTAMEPSHCNVDRLRCNLLEMLFEELRCLYRGLIRHDPHGNLRECLRGDHRLRTLAGIAAPDSIALECGARPEPFDRGESFFAKQLLEPELLRIFPIVPRQLLECCSLSFCERADVSVESRDGDSSVLVVERCDHFCEGLNGVMQRTSKRSRVQVCVGAGDLNLHIRQSAETIADGWNTLREHRGIRDEN